MNVEAVQGSHDRVCVDSLTKVGKGQAAERALLIEMVIEGIRGRNGQRCLEKRGQSVRQGRTAGGTYNDIKEGFAFYIERYVLDDDGSGYNLIIGALARSGGSYGGDEVTHRRGATRGRKVRIVVGGKRTIFGDGRRVI